jgi:radical SAM superfamily enzyme YgiQ (UPF0313 family)
MIDLLILTAPFTYTLGPSLGPALLKACVERDGYKASTWDLSAEFNHNFADTNDYNEIIDWMQSPDVIPSVAAFNWYLSIIKQYAERIVYTYRPKNLAISILTLSSQRFAEDLCYYVKILDPNLKIILGGNSLNILQSQYQKLWSDLLLDSNLCDCVVIGEGEYTLSNILANNLIGKIVSPQLTNADLSNLPVPDYSEYDMSLYPAAENTFWAMAKSIRSIDSGPIFLITGSRGCIKDCTFCDVANIWDKFRFRSGISVADEIATLHKKYDAKYFSFTDSLLNGGLRPFFEMNESLLDKLPPNTIQYEGQVICRGKNDMPEKYFKIMALAGCAHVNIGIESGSESVRAHMRKGSSNEDIAYSTEMYIKYNIKQNWNIIAGYPTETDNDWQETVDLINYWVPRSNGLLKINPINTFLILPDTPIDKTEMRTELELHQESIAGYSEFAWVSGKNPSNTYEVRARRFIELCQLLLTYADNDAEVKRLQDRIKSTNKRLNWYRDHKQRKIFNIAQS